MFQCFIIKPCENHNNPYCILSQILYPFQLYSSLAKVDGQTNSDAKRKKMTPFTPTPGSKLLGGVFGKKAKGKVLLQPPVYPDGPSLT